MAKETLDPLAVLKEAIAAGDLPKIESASAELAEALEAGPAREPEELTVRLEQAVSAGDSESVRRLTGELVCRLRSRPQAYPEAFVSVLEEAVDSFQHERVGELCDALAAELRTRPEVYPAAESKKILGLLRRKRYFATMMAVADVLLQTGQSHARIRRLYCQALLDSGRLAAGLEMLLALERDCEADGDEGELAEARGLIGRALKQMYVDAAQLGRPSRRLQECLGGAIDAYYGVYRAERSNYWHGINVVACVKRAEADEIDLEDRGIDADGIAAELREGFAAKGRRADLWEMATAAESCLAAGDFEAALEWIVRYTGETGADAFEIASTLRQFEEVWRLDSAEVEQAKILQLLRAALLEREGGSVRIDNPGVEATRAAELNRDRGYEAVLGEDRYRTYQWYATGLERASGVAQIQTLSGAGHGTGFLIPGAAVHESIGDEWVLMTNAHVISEDPNEHAGEPAALPPEEAVAVFEAGPGAGSSFELGRLLFSSPRHELDCSILTLRGNLEFDRSPKIAKRLPRLTGRKQRVYVIGHPRGGGLSFSIDDNLLLDHEAPRVHYRAPTEGGSSGSPVFNQVWQLIALHHAGGSKMKKLNNQPGTYPANEGLAISSILEAVARKLG